MKQQGQNETKGTKDQQKNLDDQQNTSRSSVRSRKTRIYWLNQRIVRKQLDIMPTYHYVQNQGKLIMRIRENAPKPQFGQFFHDFGAKYLEIAIFFEK